MTQLGHSPRRSSGATRKTCSRTPNDGALAPARSPLTRRTTTARPDATTAPSTSPGVCICSFTRFACSSYQEGWRAARPPSRTRRDRAHGCAATRRCAGPHPPSFPPPGSRRGTPHTLTCASSPRTRRRARRGGVGAETCPGQLSNHQKLHQWRFVDRSFYTPLELWLWDMSRFTQFRTTKPTSDTSDTFITYAGKNNARALLPLSERPLSMA